MADHRRLLIWQRARELSRRVHWVVRTLPRGEQFRRGDQLIRAANSVRHNISEGASGTDPEFAYYLRKALMSANETHDELDELDGVGLLLPRDRDLLEGYLELAPMIQSFRQTVVLRIEESEKKRRANARRRPNL